MSATQSVTCWRPLRRIMMTSKAGRNGCGNRSQSGRVTSRHPGEYPKGTSAGMTLWTCSNAKMATRAELVILV
jgi:hypothetical protein